MTKLAYLISPIVGAHFVPPAKILLEHLPSGASLLLEPEPDNPYDENAMLVMVEPSALPESQYAELELKLPGMGHTLEELLLGGKNLVLGHVAASGGKPLLKAIALGKAYAGTLEFLSAIRNGEAGEASLGFDEDGLPVVKLEVSR
jgi:hypothetical protein